MLYIFLRVVAAHLCRNNDVGSEHARLGALGFIHRFGSFLNRYVIFRCCIVDGVFDAARGDRDAVRLRFAATLIQDAAAAIVEQMRIHGRGSNHPSAEPGALNS